MKILIPLDDNQGFKSKISLHFGRAPYFALVDLEKGKVSLKVVENPRSKGVKPGELALSLNVDGVVIRGDIGVRALRMLREAGISIYVITSKTLGEAIKELTEGMLTEYLGEGCPGRRD